MNTPSDSLARNLRHLRETRALTQEQLSLISGIPRPTLGSLESGEANPTLSVLVKVAGALQTSVEALISPPRSTTRFYSASELKVRKRGEVVIRHVLPDVFGGLELERLEFQHGARMIGAPHKPGTREYLVCESGGLELSAAGESFLLKPGDAVVFRGDQRHSYANSTRGISVGYSVILIGPTLI